MAMEKPRELLPSEGSTLTASIEPLEEDADGLPHELLHRVAVEGHAIVLEMSSQLGTEDRPDVAEAVAISDPARPLVDSLELDSQPLPLALQLGDDDPFCERPQ